LVSAGRGLTNNPKENHMKLSAVAIDPVAHEEGEWVDNIPEMGDLRLKVRGFGNSDWRRHASKLSAAVPREKKRGGIVDDPQEIDRINTSCLVNACLLDWSGLSDDADQPLPYSKAKAAELLNDPSLRRLRDAVLWAASTVGEQLAASKEAIAGN
jgi:hypothetical protein